MSTTQTALRSGLKGLALGVFIYYTGDTLNDIYVYSVLHDMGVALANEDPEVASLIGAPFKSGAWYNATLGFSHRSNVAHVSFQLTGSQRTTDIVVRAGRDPGGWRNNILYNLLGPRKWELLSCQAMVPGPGGLAHPRSIMPEHRDEPTLGSSSSKGSTGACETGACPLPSSPVSAGAPSSSRRSTGDPAAATAAASAADASVSSQQPGTSRWWSWRRWLRRPAKQQPTDAGSGPV
jgi:hypothetical protein